MNRNWSYQCHPFPPLIRGRGQKLEFLTLLHPLCLSNEVNIKLTRWVVVNVQVGQLDVLKRLLSWTPNSKGQMLLWNLALCISTSTTDSYPFTALEISWLLENRNRFFFQTYQTLGVSCRNLCFRASWSLPGRWPISLRGSRLKGLTPSPYLYHHLLLPAGKCEKWAKL